MFENVVGDWPKHERFIITSCDDRYFNQYFPRFYKTFNEHWQLPIHVHVIDPKNESLKKLQYLKLSHTFCYTDSNILKWPYSFETYCQAQRFIVLGHHMLEGQSVIVADVDCYALRKPTKQQQDILESDMAFTEYNKRLMATFCNFHHRRMKHAKKAAVRMKDLIQNTDTIGVDQLVIKEVFSKFHYNNLIHRQWIRHHDVKTEDDLKLHNKCLIYHEKGTRGKHKGIKVSWTDIGL